MKIVIEGEETVNYSTQAAFFAVDHSTQGIFRIQHRSTFPGSLDVDGYICASSPVLSFQDQRWVSLFGPEMRTIWMSESKCNRISYWTTPSFQQLEGKATAQSAASPGAIGFIKSSSVCIVRRWDKRQRWFCDASDSDWHKREKSWINLTSLTKVRTVVLDLWPPFKHITPISWGSLHVRLTNKWCPFLLQSDAALWRHLIWFIVAYLRSLHPPPRHAIIQRQMYLKSRGI